MGRQPLLFHGIWLLPFEQKRKRVMQTSILRIEVRDEQERWLGLSEQLGAYF